MEPEKFARQFFDMWQDSFSNAMEDPNFNAKLMHLMEESKSFWYDDTEKQDKTAITTTKVDEPPNKQFARPNDHSVGTVQELAQRLEKCERRVHVLEEIIRSRFSKIPENRKSSPKRERNARIKVYKGS